MFDNPVAQILLGEPTAFPSPKQYENGDPVWWMATRGGGGGSGHKVNAKEPVEATVIRATKNRVLIHVPHRGDYYTGRTWVQKVNVVPRAV